MSTPEISRRIVNGEWATVVAESGGGGSPVSVLKTTVVLTDAQIKELPTPTTGPVEIVAAVPGSLIDVIAVTLLSNFPTPYTGITADRRIRVEHATSGTSLVAEFGRDGTYESFFENEDGGYVRLLSPDRSHLRE